MKILDCISVVAILFIVRGCECLRSRSDLLLFPFGSRAGDSRLLADAEDISQPLIGIANNRA